MSSFTVKLALALAAAVATLPANAAATLEYQFTCSAPGALETHHPFDGAATTTFWTSYGRGPYVLKLEDLHQAVESVSYWNVSFEPKDAARAQSDIAFSDLAILDNDLEISPRNADLKWVRIKTVRVPTSFELEKDGDEFKFLYIAHFIDTEASARERAIRAAGPTSKAEAFTTIVAGRCVRDR